jgi:para-aminobenzoate synthetase component I
VMIVDLLRNDLSRVCEDRSVQVPELCAVERFATVMHLVSSVTGELRPGAGAVDLLAACFPGGSITGAPKIRAMEIIADLEPTRRGPYCGAIGLVGWDGTLDTSIAIRTFAIRGREATWGAGGGIVADSDPAAEYEETLAKARALVRALSP